MSGKVVAAVRTDSEKAAFRNSYVPEIAVTGTSGAQEIRVGSAARRNPIPA